MLAETTSFTLEGIAARPIRVEVDIHRGLPSFQIVGLPDAAVREARERVRAALVNTGFDFPLRRITANLAPADLRKAGPGLDLALATGLLVASGELPTGPLAGWALAGELALDGSVRPVRGALAMTEAAREVSCRGIILPVANGPEAALAPGIEVRTIDSISDLRDFARGRVPGRKPEPASLASSDSLPDLRDLRGQEGLRRAIEVAAAGGHALLMVGPPGSGKSLAARRIPSVLPPLTGDEILEVARIAGVCGSGPMRAQRPFRAPHHTVSAAGLVGGGSPPRPGEITLAHRGVLFLDELCEFRRPALEALREPMESGEVTISRVNGRRTLPAGFTLIAAANPCPCGRGDEDPECGCSPAAIARYKGTLSGALADRIDIIAGVAQPDPEAMSGEDGESSVAVRERVLIARRRMYERLGTGRPNALATRAEVSQFELESPARELLVEAGRRQRLSGRSHDRILRLARTIADLDDGGPIRELHLAGALQLRRRSGS
ncbi:MAG: YifB family Mg chelatase-like AAA ATPase [Solirubrobacterales bacterium]